MFKNKHFLAPLPAFYLRVCSLWSIIIRDYEYKGETRIMGKKYRLLAISFILMCVFEMIAPMNVQATTVQISQVTKTMYVGDSYTLYLMGTCDKAKWSSSDKKIATVNASGRIKAKKKGNCIIKATLNGKTFKCKLNVKKAGKYLTKEQARNRIEEACRNHGLVSYSEYVDQLIASGELDESREEVMSWIHESSWFQTKIRMSGYKDGNYYPGEFDGSPAFTIEFERKDGDYYIFNCYCY